MSELRRSKRPKPADIARELDLGIRIHVVIAEATRHVRSSIANMAKVHEIYQYRRSAFNRAALPVAAPSRRRPRARKA